MNFRVEKISGNGDDKFVCGVFSKHINVSGGGSGVLVSCVLLELQNLENIESASSFLHDGFENDVRKITEPQDGVFAALVAIRDGQVGRYETMGAAANIALAFLYNGAVYIARHGDRIRVNIYRPPKSFEVKFSEGSGKINHGDLVLVSTDKFIETFNSDMFAKAPIDDFAEVIDGLATDISALANQSEVGALFVQVGQEKVEVDREDIIVPQSGESNEEIAETGADGTDSNVDDIGHVSAGSLPVKIISALTISLGRLRGRNIGALFRFRRNLIFLAFLVILILAASAFVTMRNGRMVDKSAEFSAHMQLANDKYTEAVGVLDLNREKARTLLVDADGEIKLAIALFPKNDRALSLQRQIEDKLSETANLTGVDFEQFYESRGVITAFSGGLGDFYVFGDEGVVAISDGGEEVRKISQDSADSGYVYDKSIFTMSGNRVFKLTVDGRGEEVAKVNEVRDMAVFLGNIYLLGADQIMKFVPIEGGYAQSTNYLEGPEAFGNDSRLAIDGSVWVTKGREILKYTRGVSDSFSISGISGLGDMGEIYTNSDLDKIYVVDRSNSALVVISKDGVYTKTYNSAEFAKVSDLYVDEGAGKMYVAVGNKILEAGL